MNWNLVLESIIYLIISSLIGTGIGTFIAQKLFEHRLNKNLSRFNKLFSDKLEIIKKLYTLLIKSEKALDVLLSRPRPKESAELKEHFEKTIIPLNEFIEYFEENEILLDNTTVEIINQIIERLNKAMDTESISELLKKSDVSNKWIDSVFEKENLRKKLKNELPQLRQLLKTEFQEKFKLLEG